MTGMMGSLCEYDKAVENRQKAPGATLTEGIQPDDKKLERKGYMREAVWQLKKMIN